MQKLRYQGAAARLLWGVSPIVDIQHDGWPQQLHSAAIAALQSWKDGDGENTPARQERASDWVSAIGGACKRHHIKHRVRVTSIKPLTDPDGGVFGWVQESINLISAADFLDWLHKNGEAASPLVLLWASETGAVPPQAPQPQTSKPLARQTAQEREILRIIEALGFDPKALPQGANGKPGIKAKVRAQALAIKDTFTQGTFNKAWVRLSESEEIAYRQ